MIDGKPYDVDIVMAENGSCSILHDGNSFNAELIRGEGGKSYDVNMFYRSYHVDIVDTQTKYLRMKKGGEERQDDKIVAPMPGKVVKIPVRKGDRLSSGDIVVVLEAMKMENEIMAPCDGAVTSVSVTKGPPWSPAPCCAPSVDPGGPHMEAIANFLTSTGFYQSSRGRTGKAPLCW